MQDFHVNRARTLLENAEEIFDATEVQQAVAGVADKLNERFDVPGDDTFQRWCSE